MVLLHWGSHLHDLHSSHRLSSQTGSLLCVEGFAGALHFSPAQRRRHMEGPGIRPPVPAQTRQTPSPGSSKQCCFSAACVSYFVKRRWGRTGEEGKRKRETGVEVVRPFLCLCPLPKTPCETNGFSSLGSQTYKKNASQAFTVSVGKRKEKLVVTT